MKKKPTGRHAMVPQAGYSYDANWLELFWRDYDRAVRAGEGHVGSRYMPHQGEREKARRRRQMGLSP
jgi:hypothetical protein